MTNQINCIGRLGKAPELAETEQGKPMVLSSIAVSLNQGNSNVEWFNIAAFDDHALTLASWCKKGDLIRVEGVLTTQHKKNDSKEQQTIWNIKVKEVSLQGKAAIRMNSKGRYFA